MKKLIFFAAILLATLDVAAQKKELPAAVKDPFYSKYPGALEVKFKKKKDAYRIRFVNEGLKITSLFDQEGNWEHSEYILSKENIPDKISKTIIKKYPKGSFRNAQVTETSTGGIDYEIAVDTDKFTYFLVLDKDGKIVETKKVSNESMKPEKDDSPQNNSENEGGGDGEK